MEHDVGVDDEDGCRVGVEAARGRVAGGAGGGAAGDVVAEVVLPDHLDDAPLLRLLHEGLALQHVGEVGGAQAKRRRRLLGGRGRGRVQADLRRRMAAAAAAYGGLIGLVRRGRITGLSLACVCVCIRLQIGRAHV